jgi:SAM-dependent methyltransferase
MDEYAAFADIYDEWAQSMTADVPFYVGLAKEADGPIVELAVGSGRVAIPVARETGRKVIGIDRSQSMLAQARERVAEAGVDVEIREEDMRDFELEEPAALIYCPFRALLHLPTWADRRRVFERVAAALRPGGRFAWNVFVFDPMFAARRAERLSRRPDGKAWEWTEYDPTEARIDITAYVEQPGKDPRELSLWWINRSEWEGLIDVAGLEVEALYGDFERKPLGPDDREFVWVTRKPT